MASIVPIATFRVVESDAAAWASRQSNPIGMTVPARRAPHDGAALRHVAAGGAVAQPAAKVGSLQLRASFMCVM